MKETPITYSVYVKLRPYLQEYLICKSNNNLKASQTEFVGTIIRPFITLLPEGGDPFFFTKLKDYHKDDYVEITLPNYRSKDIRNNTVYFPESNYKDFERIISVHFWDLFYNYVNDKIRYNKRIKRVIIQFCTDYNITYNRLTYEMLKKAYYRRKIKKSMESLTNFSSLSCPCFFLM